MFVGSVDLENGTGLNLVIAPLKGTKLGGCWDKNTNLILVCVMQTGRCCCCSPDTHPDRLIDKLGLGKDDAERLALWLKKNLC